MPTHECKAESSATSPAIATVVARRAGIMNMCLKMDNGRHEMVCDKKESRLISPQTYTASWSWLR